jgi:pimeloyl-ACP methyl ester carboxylesterase
MNTSQLQIDGISIHVEGDAPQVLLMIHGWPDTYHLWDGQVAHFKPHFRCVRFTLPGFDAQLPRRAYTLAELVDFIRRVVQATSANTPVTLMLHDWGCFFGYQFALRHPQRVARIVAVDVGDAGSAAFRAGCPWRGLLGILAYQSWLALAWWIAGHISAPIGNRMTRWMAHHLGCRSDPALIAAQMNYPYFITWTGAHGSYRHALPLALHCPLFYAWAERKPVMFHSAAWLAQVAAQPGNQVQAFACGHWVMTREAAAFNLAVDGWLRASASTQGIAP